MKIGTAFSISFAYTGMVLRYVGFACMWAIFPMLAVGYLFPPPWQFEITYNVYLFVMVGMAVAFFVFVALFRHFDWGTIRMMVKDWKASDPDQ